PAYAANRGRNRETYRRPGGNCLPRASENFGRPSSGPPELVCAVLIQAAAGPAVAAAPRGSSTSPREMSRGLERILTPMARKFLHRAGIASSTTAPPRLVRGDHPPRATGRPSGRSAT